MILSAIISMTPTGIIALDGNIPWHQSEDMARFRETTMGHAVIMGRTTFESLPKRLDGRKEIVITSHPETLPDGVTPAENVYDAIRCARRMDETEAFIIGGASVYDQTIGLVDKVYLTVVFRDALNGDITQLNPRTVYYLRNSACFSHSNLSNVKDRDSHNDYQYQFRLLERKLPCNYAHIYAGNVYDDVIMRVPVGDKDSPKGGFIDTNLGGVIIPLTFIDGRVVGYCSMSRDCKTGSDNDVHDVTFDCTLIDNDATRTLRAMTRAGMEFSLSVSLVTSSAMLAYRPARCTADK